jgi:ligand-binding sensor domain-containing protein
LLRAQRNDLKFEHITIDDGLSQSRVRCLYQDSRGFMWVGTHEGLNKFDGYDFTIYLKDSDSEGNISGNIIRCIFEDSKDNLWIGTFTNGLNRYDRASNKFFHYNQNSDSLVQLSGNTINSIFEDKQGHLWLGTDSGIDRLDPIGKECINYMPYDPLHYPANYNEVNVMYKDKRDYIWIGTIGGGLCGFDRNTKKFEYFVHDPRNSKSISDNNVISIFEDENESLWIGTYNGGFNLLDREKKEFHTFYPDPKAKASLTIKAILGDKNGGLWIASRDGLYLFNIDSHQYIRYAHDPHNQSSLSNNNVQAIYKDMSGNFWFGTKRGLNLLKMTNIPFVHYRADVYNKNFLNHELVNAILEDNCGDLWFGTEEGGLNHLDRKTGTYTYYLHNSLNPITISDDNITALAEDKNQNLWIGTLQGGLNFFDRKTNRFLRYKINPDNPLIYQDSIHSLLIDREGEIWIASSALYRFDRKQQVLVEIPLDESQSPPEIRSMIQDHSGNILVGSDDGKIYCYNKKEMDHKLFQLEYSSEYSRINALYEDGEYNLWIGTVGRGLYSLDREKKLYRQYTVKDGLPSNRIGGILEDSQKNLWISTTKGLSKFDSHKKTFKNYYKENGLQSNLFTQACYQTRDGEMMFGGINGVTAFYPEKILRNSFIPPVAITDFKIFNQSVQPGIEDQILKEHISVAQQISLSYKHAVFTFTFAALNYAITEQNRYAYMMEGFEEDWNYVDSNKRFATYTNLDPGEYVFRVKAANSDDVWNEEGASVRINIFPPFWETWWFKMFIFALLLFFTWLIFNYFRQKRDLLKSTSLANLSQLKLLRNQMNPHFLFNALGSIRSLININKEKAWQLVSELSEFFQYTLLNYNKLEATLNEEIEAAKNYLNIENIQYKNPLKISFNVDETAGEQIVPAFILQPLIENALKHGLIKASPNDFEIRIVILYTDGTLSIDISNTGKLADPVSEDSEGATAHGTSLRNIRSRLKLMYDNNFTFKIFEENRWVHVRIMIQYENSKYKRAVETTIDDINTME